MEKSGSNKKLSLVRETVKRLRFATALRAGDTSSLTAVGCPPTRSNNGTVMLPEE